MVSVVLSESDMLYRHGLRGRRTVLAHKHAAFAQMLSALRAGTIGPSAMGVALARWHRAYRRVRDYARCADDVGTEHVPPETYSGVMECAPTDSTPDAERETTNTEGPLYVEWTVRVPGTFALPATVLSPQAAADMHARCERAEAEVDARRREMDNLRLRGQQMAAERERRRERDPPAESVA